MPKTVHWASCVPCLERSQTIAAERSQSNAASDIELPDMAGHAAARQLRLRYGAGIPYRAFEVDAFYTRHAGHRVRSTVGECGSADRLRS